MAFSSLLTWQQAASACSVLKAHPASIPDAVQETLVKGLVAGTGPSWVGLTDQFGEGTFIWYQGPNNGLAQTYAGDWEAGQPDNLPGNNANCVRLAGTGWTDELCDVPRAYVCEHDF